MKLVKKSTSVPFFSTTSWLPRVPFSCVYIGFAADHVFPPSVVVEMYAGPLFAFWPFPELKSGFWLANRSQTTYATPGLVGSAVIDSLSKPCVKLFWGELTTTAGVPQVRPSSVDVLTVMALLPVNASKTSAAWY